MSHAATHSNFPGLEARPLAGSLGAELRGVDVNNLDQPGFDALYQAFLDYQVVVLPGQNLDPERYLGFAQRWGAIHQHPFMAHLDDYPGILEIVKTETDTAAFGNGWHSDQMFAARPAKCTMLYALEVPSAGGDTLFSDMYAAYEALSPGMALFLEGIRGFNTGDREKLRRRRSRQLRERDVMSRMVEKTPERGLKTESAHPLVRTHADTGRKALYIGGHTVGIAGWADEESRPLIDFLRRHSERPEFTCRVSWQPGTLTIWDNRCVQHYAVNDYPGQRRRMHRITVAGDEVPA